MPPKSIDPTLVSYAAVIWVAMQRSSPLTQWSYMGVYLKGVPALDRCPPYMQSALRELTVFRFAFD